MYAARRRQKSVRGKFQFGKLLEADTVHIVRRNFPVLIQHDHIADRQAVPMGIRRAGAVEFLVQLFQQLRLQSEVPCGHLEPRQQIGRFHYQ